MSTTFYIFLGLIIIVAFLLVVVIMVQNPKGGGLSSSFGGGGTQQMGGVQKTTDFLDKATWALATLLLILILASNLSIFDGSVVAESQVFDEDSIENTTPAPAPVSLPDDTTNDTDGN
ncbi:preprotein translocase subunit SecG [Dokdonia sp. Hel_I_53]|uniref:preprotein translocase subunit SecG n=1 Tax=Dokdonia sp. Hel_I_53 TaxID=1566287 RepID=UPI00119B1757|nr:preprotein translocase subunit SecG [Dokdonia sp. Hel_I_53]TVZ52155.1 protein translocase subunit secG [Dokdonia sp. Hel_I_53]